MTWNRRLFNRGVIRRLILLPIAALLLGAAAQPAQPDQAAAQRVRADVEFLASDLLEGRDTGSRGHEIAAAYVASQFLSIGLKPAGTGGTWLQQVPFRRALHAGPPQASLVIGSETIQLGGDDFAVRPSLTEQQRTIDAPLVFAGRGISDARLGIDDYSGIDARGKIVVVLEGSPHGLPSEVAAHLDSSKRVTAAAKGAIGLIEVARPGRQGSSPVAFYARPPLDWVGPSRASRPELSGGMSREIVRRLFAVAGRDFDRTLAESTRHQSVPGFAFPARLKIGDRMQWHDFSSPNVVGMIPGADPALKDEHVVLMGHLDHLGVRSDAKPGEDRIYNGAIDNAVGIATMIEAARAFAASGKPPRRTVLFVAVTGEERGLRGADYFASNPPVPKERIVGVVNLDMPLPLYEFTDIVAFGGEHSTLSTIIGRATKAMGVTMSPDPMPQEAIFVRSDHYRFVTRGIPAVLLMTGYANGGEAKWKEFFATVYHKPSDDLSQPLRWDQAARYAELNYRIARELADSNERPRWYEGGYFGESFAPSQDKAKR